MTSSTHKPRILLTRAIFPQVFERLSAHFEVEANPTDDLWDRAELLRRLQGKIGVFTTGVERIDAALLAQCPDLKICANMTVGYNNFDLEAMTTAGVLGTNAPDVLTETTADFGFALLMATARRVTESEHFLRAGQWTRWSYDMFSGAEVHGSTLGILGMGRIGQAIARRGALGFGMQVIYHNRSALSAAATLINIARGGIVDDAALAQALKNRVIAAAGLDVYEGEPSVHPDLLTVPNVVLTPHIASATEGTRRAMADLAVDNLVGYLVNGRAVTPLNPEAIATA